MLNIQHYAENSPYVALAVLSAPAAAQSLPERLDAHIAPYAEGGWFSGTVLVARGDSILYERSFGLADREHDVPMTPRTRLNVASITKPMTVVIAAALLDAGTITLDQTLDAFIDDFPRGDRITVSHLLNHRATIPHRVTTPEQETVPRTAADMVELARAADPLPHEPGEESVYSSAGYSVLARVLELAGGADYQELLERYVTGPAGMARTLHTDGRTVLPDRATPYQRASEGMVHARYQDLSFLVGAGSVYSTPRDLFRMMRALVAGDLGEAARDALLRESGIGWNGSTSGFRAWADWHRDTDVSVVLTANIQSGVNDLLRTDIPRLVAGEAVEPVPVPDVAAVSVPADRLTRFEGDYQRPGGSPLTLEAADNGVWIGTWWLIATSDTTFFSPNDFGIVTLRENAAGGMELTWETPGYSAVWPRIRQ